MKRLPKTTKAEVDGLLLVDKPAGISSHDVVAIARRALGEKSIGHGGTLDPFATGLLVLLVGRATRLLQYVPGDPKRYVATVRFGGETDTEDLGGVVVREAPLPTPAALEAARLTLIGDIDQVPPAYSAKKVGGTRAYELARKGEAPELAPVGIRVDTIDLDGFELGPDGTVASCTMHVACGGGTYVRSLARDLARAAGSAAHLVALRRTAAGPFSVEGASTLEDLQEKRVVLRAPLEALPGYPHQILADDEIDRVARGIDVPARLAGAHVKLVERKLDGTDVLVAFAERRASEVGDRWQPRVVMRER